MRENRLMKTAKGLTENLQAYSKILNSKYLSSSTWIFNCSDRSWVHASLKIGW